MPEQPLIDLRSDTVTRPTKAMRDAMANAEVGDDVYAEDPTVNRLEAQAAAIFGKEAALFVPTGTMGNTIAIKLHTHHGEEVICDDRAHIMDWELSMMAWFSGCIARPVRSANGILEWADIEKVARGTGPHRAPTTLISLENTHNMAGGTVYPLDTIHEICQAAHDRGIRVHMDGARIFNASVACGVPVSAITEHVDSVMFCLSKALGAPVGSLLVGRAADIARGRLYRKRLGGGMRQVGVLAAAGLIALTDMPGVLAADHENARLLADSLSKIDGIQIDKASVQTNIVIFSINDLGCTTSEFSKQLNSRGVLANGISDYQMRLVTHFDVSRRQCVEAAEVIAELASMWTASPVRQTR
jgi:threonine aldolase